VAAVAVGNGTGGRETEVFARAALRQAGLELPVLLVNEAGASVYSTSEAAKAEFPDLDPGVRGAISIARRLQDPLAELLKLEPRSIGVGQYQHDVAHAALKHALDAVVEGCVHEVGVNLNSAPRQLLAHVAGLGPAPATAIVEWREKQGPFRSRRQLLEVPGLGPKEFEQAAGFLRVVDGENPLDNTGVHPERYAALEAFAARTGHGLADLVGPGARLVHEAVELKEELGALTWEDIASELAEPGRDPRGPFVAFSFREDVQKLEDLKPGMALPGIVNNVTTFGAFVDIGVRQDGLVHISQLGKSFVKEPREVVRPGDRVLARVLKVDLEKKQISLSLRPPPKPERRPTPKRAPRREAQAAEAGRPQAQPPAEGAERTPRPATRRGPARKERRPAAEGASAPRPAADRPPASRSERPPRPERPGEARRPGETRRPAARPPAEKRPESRRPAFNNPFAVLATLKTKKS
jgi:protein Tex